MVNFEIPRYQGRTTFDLDKITRIYIKVFKGTPDEKGWLDDGEGILILPADFNSGSVWNIQKADLSSSNKRDSRILSSLKPYILLSLHDSFSLETYYLLSRLISKSPSHDDSILESLDNVGLLANLSKSDYENVLNRAIRLNKIKVIFNIIRETLKIMDIDFEDTLSDYQSLKEKYTKGKKYLMETGYVSGSRGITGYPTTKIERSLNFEEGLSFIAFPLTVAFSDESSFSSKAKERIKKLHSHMDIIFSKVPEASSFSSAQDLKRHLENIFSHYYLE